MICSGITATGSYNYLSKPEKTTGFNIPEWKTKPRKCQTTRSSPRTPTRQHLKNAKGVQDYCRRHKLNDRVQKEMVKLVTGEPTMCNFDHRDLRTVPKCDRVPRSIEAPCSPTGYWKVCSPCTKVLHKNVLPHITPLDLENDI